MATFTAKSPYSLDPLPKVDLERAPSIVHSRDQAQ